MAGSFIQRTGSRRVVANVRMALPSLVFNIWSDAARAAALEARKAHSSDEHDKAADFHQNQLVAHANDLDDNNPRKSNYTGKSPVDLHWQAAESHRTASRLRSVADQSHSPQDTAKADDADRAASAATDAAAKGSDDYAKQTETHAMAYSRLHGTGEYGNPNYDFEKEGNAAAGSEYNRSPKEASAEEVEKGRQNLRDKQESHQDYLANPGKYQSKTPPTWGAAAGWKSWM